MNSIESLIVQITACEEKLRFKKTLQDDINTYYKNIIVFLTEANKIFANYHIFEQKLQSQNFFNIREIKNLHADYKKNVKDNLSQTFFYWDVVKKEEIKIRVERKLLFLRTINIYLFRFLQNIVFLAQPETSNLTSFVSGEFSKGFDGSKNDVSALLIMCKRVDKRIILLISYLDNIFFLINKHLNNFTETIDIKKKHLKQCKIITMALEKECQFWFIERNEFRYGGLIIDYQKTVEFFNRLMPIIDNLRNTFFYLLIFYQNFFTSMIGLEFYKKIVYEIDFFLNQFNLFWISDDWAYIYITDNQSDIICAKVFFMGIC